MLSKPSSNSDTQFKPIFSVSAPGTAIAHSFSSFSCIFKSQTKLGSSTAQGLPSTVSEQELEKSTAQRAHASAGHMKAGLGVHGPWISSTFAAQGSGHLFILIVEKHKTVLRGFLFQ